MKRETKKITKTKKISFFSAMMFVVGSSVGAGIFLKNDEVLKNTHFSIVFSLIAWFVALVGILAMGFALVEIVSGTHHQNKEGIVGWVKTFNNKYLYLGARDFMAYIYLPINVFAMPFYVIKQFAEGVGWQPEWYWVALISFVIMIYFIVSTTLSTKLANTQNLVTLVIKFFPLLVALFLGFIFIGLGNHTANNWFPSNNDPTGNKTFFNNLTPWLGIFMSVPSILFVVDGFYSSTAIQSDMREPHKMPKAIMLGLLIIFILDIIISVSLMFGPDKGGGIPAFKGWLPDWLYQTILVLVAVGILGIVNGICAYGAKMYMQMIEDNTMLFAKKIKQRHPHINVINLTLSYNLIINIGFFVIATTIGCFFINTSFYTYGGIDDNLYSFVDLTANWTALFAFLIICIAIIGGLMNRSHKRIVVAHRKTFIPFALIATIIISLSTIMAIANAIGNVVLISIAYGTTYDNTDLVGAILMLLVMILFMVVLFWRYGHYKIKQLFIKK